MFISEVFALDSSNSGSVSFLSFIPLILIFAVFYFLVIRPNHKKLKEHKKMIDQIRSGDSIITSGGIICEVRKVDEVNAQLLVEIAPKIEIKILKSSVSQVLNKETQKVAAKPVEKGKIEKNGKKSKSEESKKSKGAS